MSASMRILITNDDGISAPGLSVLEEIAKDLAGARGEVWTVAPELEQSGVGHCISSTQPFQVYKQNQRQMMVAGTPADCVLAAIHDFMVKAPPDLVLAGVNWGNNSGENASYSGTVGAAMEAAFQGFPAIALSQFLGPENYDLANPFEAASKHGAAVVRRLLGAGQWEKQDYQVFYNVNFPPVCADGVKGMKIAKQGFRRTQHYGVRAQTLSADAKARSLCISTASQVAPTSSGSDVQANIEGYISITPMRADLTAHDLLGPLESTFV